MVYDEIFFGGEVLPCLVEKFPVIRKPQRKHTIYNIPGRTGDIIIQQDAYENVIVPYQICCGDGDVQTDWTDLANVLYKDGYQKLQDISDPEHFRKAVFNGPIDAAYYWEKVGRTTLEFNCRPERYLVGGANPVTYNAQANWVKIYDREELGHIAQDVENWFDHSPDDNLATEQTFYVCTIPAWYPDDDPTVIIPCRDNGQVKSFYIADDITNPVNYEEIGTDTKEMVFNGYAYAQSGLQIVIPQYTIVGYPIVYLDFNGQIVPYGTSLTLNNPYMESYPDIILHRITDHHLLEETTTALQINRRYITITQKDASTPPYYFIDTENMIVTSAQTLTGMRSIANNVSMVDGLSLKHGENLIYPGMYYDAIITTNFWEL